MKYISTEPPAVQSNVVEFYRHALTVLREERIPFLIGGAYALKWHTGISYPTKDLDLMVQAKDSARTMETLQSAGYQIEMTFPHWLGKVFCGDAFIDVIFNAGNGMIPVDRDWLRYAVRGEMFGVAVEICSPVELIWSKAFVMERERYDGADVLHLIRSCEGDLDWPRLLKRFGSHWPVLLSHLVLFGYVYPSERSRVPRWVLRVLLRRMQTDTTRAVRAPHLCRGTLLSREQYLIDVEQAGYDDARLPPRGTMSPEDIARWTAAITDRNSPSVGPNGGDG
jgi:hypothetical protein